MKIQCWWWCYSSGILHDIIEDTHYTKDELYNDFGERISIMVYRVYR